MKLVIATLMLAGVALFATPAGATNNTGVQIHGPHCQENGTRTQVRLSINKSETFGAPLPPTAFVPYSWGPVTGDNASWHVTGTADGFAGASFGMWAGQPVTIPAFEGNKNCQPPETTTTTVPEETTTTTTTVAATPPPAQSATPTAPPLQTVETPAPVAELPNTGAKSTTDWLALIGALGAGVGLIVHRLWGTKSRRGLDRGAPVG